MKAPFDDSSFLMRTGLGPRRRISIKRFCGSLYLSVNILYVSQYFPPEMGAPAARVAELVRHWAQNGHQVSVLTGFPNHPTGVVPPEWRPRLRRLICHERIFPKIEHIEAEALGSRACTELVETAEAQPFDVFRTWLWPLPNRKAHERIRNYSSFCVSAGLRGLTLPRPDVLIATSPQLLVALAGWWLAFARQVPFIFEVRDLWPESLAAVGMGNEDSLLHQMLSQLSSFLYTRANLIVVVTPAFREYLVRQWRIPPEKIAVVENGVETDLFSPLPELHRSVVRQQIGADNEFLVSYIGTMGAAHGLETLLDAAARLQHAKPEVMFLLIGEGAEKDRIKSHAQSLGLTNVRFLDQQPREKIPAFISASDACLVLLKKADVFKTVIPTKMLEFMSCARPVILGVEGQAQQVVEKAGAGLVIEPENAYSLAAAIAQLAENRSLGIALGGNGRQYVLQHLSRAQTAKQYLHLIERLLRSSQKIL
jgi:colanic acid biosynthesis glycosyl transferase WcaI